MSILQAQEAEKHWRVWVQGEDPFCLPTPKTHTLGAPLWGHQSLVPPENPSGPNSREASPPPPLGGHQPVGSVTEAFPGVVRDHRLPRKGLWVTRQSVKSEHPEPSKDNSPCTSPRGLATATTSPNSCLLPWTRYLWGRRNL